jgi:predicted transcriptional regulator
MMMVIASLVGLLTSILITIALFPQAPSYPISMNEMMRRMMGGHFGEIPQQSTMLPSYILLIPFAFTILAVVSIIGLIYFFTYPEIKKVKGEKGIKPNVNSGVTSTQSIKVVMRTLKPDELKVIEILRAHNGKYLQKYISKEAGLTRLKTHRIVARLAERGIVKVKEYGNTNEITLSEWLLRESNQNKKDE